MPTDIYGLGKEALFGAEGTDLLAVGKEALFSSGTTDIVGIGHEALFSSDSIDVVALGHEVLFNYVSGYLVLAVGHEVLYNIPIEESPMPTQVNHNTNNTYNVILDPPSQEGATLTKPLLLVPLEFNPLGDPAQRIITFANYDQALEASNETPDPFISASTLAAVSVAFQQEPKPAFVKVANIDLENDETIDDALDAIKALDNDWYGLSIWSRTAADIVTASTWIETQQKIFVAQSSLSTVVGAFPDSLEYITTNRS